MAKTAWIERYRVPSRRSVAPRPHSGRGEGVRVLTAALTLATSAASALPLQTVEPRYVVVCFPAILAIGAAAFANPGREIRAADERQA